MDRGVLGTHERKARETFQSLVPAIGMHVTLLVLERALWLTRHKYEEAALIRFSEAGIALDRLDEVAPEQARRVADAFLLAIAATLARLVGEPVARQLTRNLETLNNGG